MNNKIKKYFSVIILACLIAVIMYSGIRPMIVMSGSMEPEIKTGSLCFVNTKADYNKIKKDDVITYRLLDAYITHRVTEVTNYGFITKGDSNNTEDFGIVTEKNFYGKEAGHIPYAGYVLFYLKKNMLIITAVVIFVYLVFKAVFYSVNTNRTSIICHLHK